MTAAAPQLERRRRSTLPDRIRLEMTPMIDVVFQLLIFFMFSFRIASVEGDFNVKMPELDEGGGAPLDDSLLPLRVRLLRPAPGEVAIELNDQPVGSFAELRAQVQTQVGDNTGPDSRAAKTEVILDCDYDLDYRYVIEAITHLRGVPAEGSGEFVPLVERINFARPREPAPE